MKVNTILKSIISTKIRITDTEENNFYTYRIDYCNKDLKVGEVKKYDWTEFHTCPVTLPKTLLQREVRYITTFSSTGEIEIVLK